MIHREPCPYDAGNVQLVTGADIYPHRPDLYHKQFWRCCKCGAYTGCHPGTTKRVGRLANAETRALKVAAHTAFDHLWQSGRMSRTQAYRWLQQATGLGEHDCHIGWMSDDMLRAIPALVARFQNTPGAP